MFILNKGRTRMAYLPVTPSTAIAKGSLVVFSSGKLIAAVAGSAKEDIAGVLMKDIVSTDSDYATDRLVPIEVPLDKNTQYEADVTSGLVAGDIGGFFDLTDANNVNRAASSTKVVQCRKVLSTTKGIFSLNIQGAGA